ncbi:MAG TPA: hypothetical protein VF594_06120 [Rubricoccaceae bacterium]|jgi:hypothetical protein
MVVSELAPKELAFPAAVAFLSAACLGGAYALVAVEPHFTIGRWQSAAWPTALGFGLGMVALVALVVRWHRNRGQDRVRRATWIAITTLFLVPSLIVAGFVVVTTLRLLLW